MAAVLTTIVIVIVIVTLGLLVTRIATVALTMTGMSLEHARFQARSAFTGTRVASPACGGAHTGCGTRRWRDPSSRAGRVCRIDRSRSRKKQAVKWLPATVSVGVPRRETRPETEASAT